jgi:dienelactone hydrolase
VEAGSDPARGLRFVLRPVPAPPAPPYSTRNIRFESAGARLAGTLFIPSGAARRHAGIVILQGSSSNLREEYRFYADHFARAGLAVLTFDKRGKGESGGDYGAASYDVLAEDGAAAVEFLGAQPEVASKRVGVWGLSQGAFIAPRVAARVPSLTFIVAVSPAGVSIGECATYQDSVRLISGGFSTAEAARVATLNREIITWLETGRGEAALAAGLARDADAPWRRASALPVRLPRGAARSGWYWRGRILDPIPSWRALRVPVLAVFGAADELLPARTSAARIERALEEGKNPDHLVRVFPAANHVLRRLPLLAGDRWDWPRAAPGYMDLVTGWILDHAKE